MRWQVPQKTNNTMMLLQMQTQNLPQKTSQVRELNMLLQVPLNQMRLIHQSELKLAMMRWARLQKTNNIMMQLPMQTRSSTQKILLAQKQSIQKLQELNQ